MVSLKLDVPNPLECVSALLRMGMLNRSPRTLPISGNCMNNGGSDLGLTRRGTVRLVMNLRRSRYALLRTFRRDCTPVGTPIWFRLRR